MDDIEVLATPDIFDDPFYEASEMQSFGKDSADIHISFYWFGQYQETNSTCLIDGFTVKVEEKDNPAGFGKELILLANNYLTSDPIGSGLVLTVPSGHEYTVSVVGSTASCDSFIGEEVDINVPEPLEDHWFSPRAFPVQPD